MGSGSSSLRDSGSFFFIFASHLIKCWLLKIRVCSPRNKFSTLRVAPILKSGVVLGSKCQVIRVTFSRTPFIYTPWAGPGGCQLCQVLAVEISGDLSWIVHVDRVATTANKTLGFIRRNIKTKSPTVQEMAYQSLVRLNWSMLLQCGIIILRNRPINRNDLKKSSP